MASIIGKHPLRFDVLARPTHPGGELAYLIEHLAHQVR
jgi:hypothetical protein